MTLQPLQCGKGFLKFKSSLLKDKKYVKLEKSTIKGTINQYRCKEGNVSINYELLWEMIILMIPVKTIQYSFIRKENMKRWKLHTKHEELDETDVKDTKLTILCEIDKLKKERKEIMKIRPQGRMVRSKETCIEHDEKTSK